MSGQENERGYRPGDDGQPFTEVELVWLNVLREKFSKRGAQDMDPIRSRLEFGRWLMEKRRITDEVNTGEVNTGEVNTGDSAIPDEEDLSAL